MAINKPLKNRIKELSEIHYDNHMDKWENGKYSIGDRRIMVTHWVGQAWRELHAEQSHLIIKAFRKVGLSLAVDGSEDVELHVKDIPDIQVGNWTREEEILLDEINDQGDRVVPNEPILNDTQAGDPLYCIDWEEEAVQHDPEVDVEGEEDKEWWIK